MSQKLNLFDFDYSLHWPPNQKYPLNLSSPHDRSVEHEVLKDLEGSDEFLIITGFTSLSYLIDLYYLHDYVPGKKVRVVLGFEPMVRQRKKWPRVKFSQAVAEFWLDRGISPLQSGGVIKLIEHIEKGDIEFRVSEKIHAKIYVGSEHATLGSSNFSKNGLTKQREANIRVCVCSDNTTEQQQYKDISLIAENFFVESDDYKAKILELLNLLLKATEWPEALARAIAELIEGDWIEQYPEAFRHLKDLELWPSQRIAIGQALQIIDTQGSVLIADPTGSGKTKLASSLQVSLINRRWIQGKGDKTNSLVICPPLIIENWNKEYEKMRFSQQSPLSNGILSYEASRKHEAALSKVKNCDIMIIDEAHNYLRPRSIRSLSIKNSLADCVMLVTATPINKKADDLLRLIELLDIDNLRDDELEEYKKLRRTGRTKQLRHYQQLSDYIKKFTVRRTKKQLNLLVEKDRESYTNSEGNLCKYPKHVCKVYNTGESDSDKEKAKQINELASKLAGLINLRKLLLPLDYNDDPDSKEKYIQNRLVTAKALAKYHIQSKMRSSRVALIEHVLGTSEAGNWFGFKPSKKNQTGDQISTLTSFIDSNKLPKTDFESELLPEVFKDLDAYKQACQNEILIYRRIAEIGKTLSNARELAKLDKISNLFKSHKLILAFDSTITTLDYLNHLIAERNYSFKPLVITGEKDKAKLEAKEIFGLGSQAENYLGLCSDSMAEGVNLQQASAIILLDMPSVLRIAEQRIGRLDRMDSPHQSIQAWWPNDSAEFALKTDRKLIRISFVTGHLIGSNLDLPEELLGKHMDETISADEMIKVFENTQDQSTNWDGIHDAFQPIRDLISGETAIIPEETYDYYKSIQATVRCKVSIVDSKDKFGFFAIRGTETRAPKWVFIDDKKQIEHELQNICEKLRETLPNVQKSEWSQEAYVLMQSFLMLLLQNELQLLPQKKKRAINLLFKLLDYYERKEKKPNSRKAIVFKLKKALEQDIFSEESIDYHRFADYWLSMIQPVLTDIRKKARTPKVISDLFGYYKKYPLSDQVLDDLYEHIPFIDKIDHRIAACIIGIGEPQMKQD